MLLIGQKCANVFVVGTGEPGDYCSIVVGGRGLVHRPAGASMAAESLDGCQTENIFSQFRRKPSGG